MTRESELIRIVDAAMAEAARKSGPWLVCRPGCTECCIGPFPITPADGARLRAGLAELRGNDAARAEGVLQRARDYVEDDDSPCPVLDPSTGTCDLYSARPVTCRLFGPAVRAGGDVLGVCELNYEAASDAEIASCMVEIDPAVLEEEEPSTTVAAALTSA